MIILLFNLLRWCRACVCGWGCGGASAEWRQPEWWQHGALADLPYPTKKKQRQGFVKNEVPSIFILYF